MGEWSYSSTILILQTRWIYVVSFAPVPLYPRGNSSRHPLDGKLVRPQSRSGRRGEEKNVLSLPEIEPLYLGSPDRNLSLFRLRPFLQSPIIILTEQVGLAVALKDLF
jgi:hypothetical protein